jgi:ferredoxin
MPMTAINIAKVIENEGYEAIPYGHLSPWRAVGQVGELKRGWSRPVAPDRATPDVMVNLRIAAYLCGLGEIGWSKMFLTPEFGPRNRIGIIITELELEPDPVYDGPALCNRCMACAEACPGGAIPTDQDKSVKATLAGREVEWADIDMWNCDTHFRGATGAQEGEPGDYTEMWCCEHGTKPHEYSPFYKRPNKVYEYGQAICGARGCMRACMISLEKRGVLKNKFHSEFRRRKPWSVDWSQPMGNFPAWGQGLGEDAEWAREQSEQRGVMPYESDAD